MRGPIVRRIAFLLAAATVLAFPTDGALADTGTCHSIEYERAAYIICEVDLRRHTVRLYWTRPDGTPYAYLSDLPRDLEGGAGRLLFATNAGMFDSLLKPVGLYVERGRELVHANTRSGKGNFHMKPNGIFYIFAGNAAIAETRAFLKQRPQVDLATQSGPMLVAVSSITLLMATPSMSPRGSRRPTKSSGLASVPAQLSQIR